MAYCELDNSPPGRNQASNVPRSSFRPRREPSSTSSYGMSAGKPILESLRFRAGRNFAIAEWPTASGPADRRGEERIAYE
jgi:hypothetical protein